MRKLALLVAVVLAALLLLQLTRRPPGTGRGESEGPLVSLAPNLTGLLFELGCGPRLVGVTTYCNDPVEALSIEKIGDFLNPNIERIISLKPDLVLAEEWGSSRTVPRLRELGMEVAELPSPRSMDDIYELVMGTGRLVNRMQESRILIAEMKERVSTIQKTALTFPFRPRLYLEIDIPHWTVGGPSFTSEAIQLCGADNIFSDLATGAPQVSEEAIIRHNPDIIISFKSDRDAVAARPGWQQIEAVRQNRIIDDLDPDLLSRGNHRIVDGIEILQHRIRAMMGF